MSNRSIDTEEQKSEFVQLWKYLSANGKLFIPVENTPDNNAVYIEDYIEEKRKIVRAFMDAQAIELYIMQIETDSPEFPPGTLKVGIAPVKTLQKQMSEIYGKAAGDDITVECILTTFDELGDMKEIDVIWSQNYN